MPATVRASYYGASASEPAGVSAEGGVTFSESDAQAPAAGVSPVQIPGSTGTAYSWIMLLALEVTATAATTISNRKIKLASSMTSGLALFFAQQPTYRRPASGNAPADSGSAGPATPTPVGADAPGSYTAMTTSLQTWDSGSDSAGATGRSGDFVELVFAVDNSYAGGGGQASLPNLNLSYDEA